MNRKIPDMLWLFLLSVISFCGSAAYADSVHDDVVPVRAADVRLAGYVAAKMNALVHERFMSETARTVIY